MTTIVVRASDSVDGSTRWDELGTCVQRHSRLTPTRLAGRHESRPFDQ